VVVVMTDGRDEDNPGTGPGSVRRLDDVAQLIQESGALVFGIGLGTTVDRATLQRIADWSGGRAFFPKDVEELPSSTPRRGRPAAPLRGRLHVLTHQRDGTWRDVTIQVKSQPDAVVKTVGGYFAPSR
jgi:hypothetical protein